MKTSDVSRFFLFRLLVAVFIILPSVFVFAAENENNSYLEFKGIITDSTTGHPMPFASISVEGTNATTVSNSEGEFTIKILEELADKKLLVQFIGYKTVFVQLASLKPDHNRIEMEPVAIELPEISIISKDATELVQIMMQKRDVNYPAKEMHLTSFYRESIKKNRSYASLSEAVVDVYKQSYSSYKNDIVKMYKARKNTNYQKLDTLVFKLMGGPVTSLYLDVMKHPDLIFTDEMFKNYTFSFDFSTRIDNQLIYVIDFKPGSDFPEPLYSGRLYIDAETQALKSAVFSLDLKDKDKAADLFIVHKPLHAKAIPVQANYRIDYTEKDGKWYYNYSRIELGMKVIWEKKLFNTHYYATIEMAVTDRDNTVPDRPVKYRDRLRPNVVVSDEAAGFADPEFWGDFNVIEPEKSIESAIRKIQRQLEKKSDD
ncbi:MAG: carboxypeptidase-like regulatory domain-containing protein [Paludibacter sp.]|nr:carboxypeptidase-like regulatory domain-containing protein [Paludibacter sp.]